MSPSTYLGTLRLPKGKRKGALQMSGAPLSASNGSPKPAIVNSGKKESNSPKISSLSLS